MKKILVILEVSKKQEYIFSEKGLKENINRSNEINYVTSSRFFEYASKVYNKNDNFVYSGGGHTILQFDNDKTAYKFINDVTKTVLKEFPKMELFAKKMFFNDKLYAGENLKELSKALEEKKSIRETAFRQISIGVEKLDIKTYIDKKCFNDIIASPNGYEFAKEFDDIVIDNDNFIAIVHIDGNAMGKRVDNIYQKAKKDWNECRTLLDKFSRTIQSDFETAFNKTVEKIILSDKITYNKLPIRPIILAGDDVCFVTSGKIGLECARIFIENLTTMKNQVDNMFYSACAGVVLVHKKFPFYKAYELSEQLCSNAKKFGVSIDENGSVSAIDWHIEFGQLKNELSEIRKDYITEDNNNLSLRPVIVNCHEDIEHEKTINIRNYDFFSTLCTAIQSETIARSKIKEFRQALKQGEIETKFYMHDKQIADLIYNATNAIYRDKTKRWEKFTRMLSQNEPLEKTPFMQIDNEKYCLFLDAIEMMDNFQSLKEVQE